jgi:hypothetical protein
MKKAILLGLALLCLDCAFAQNTNLAGPSTYIKCSEFSLSKPIREMPVLSPKQVMELKETGDAIRQTRAMDYRSKFKPGAFIPDPVVQTSNGDRTASNGPIVNFDGQISNDVPPDPDGAVGPNHFVQAINTAYTVYNKTGTLLAGPVDLTNLFPGTNDDGDPIVLYDKFADRWFISEFQTTNTPYQLMVAISKTNDPTGAYYTYRFNVGSNFNNDYPDYPKFSIWTDGYYATAQFGVQRIIVLERNRMLAGSASSGMIVANLPASPSFGANNSLYTAPKTFDCDGVLPPYGTPNYLTFFENINSGGASNTIVLYKIATDTSTKVITVTKSDSMATAPFNAYFSGGNLTDISMPGSPESLDALDGTFNFRVPFMKFVGYNSVVLCNTVNTGNMVAGIRWYELRQNDTTLQWSIHQQGTYAPAGPVSRWNGSICMNNNGDISLAYSVSDSISTYPGIRYTGRLSSDPLGTMTLTEQTAIAGTSSYLGVGGRCGDYSQTTLDPTDGMTFWHTNEYGNGGGNQYTRIFSFKLPDPQGLPNIKDLSELLVYQNGQMLNIKVSDLPSNDKVVIDLFDINGKHLISEFMMPAGNIIQTELNVSGLSKGVYFVRIGNISYQKVSKVIIN